MDNKGVFLYGRARRIALAKIIVGSIVVIIIIAFVVIALFDREEEAVVNREYSFLTNYFTTRGYSCENLIQSGSKCVLKNDTLNKSFYRYDDGFQVIINSDSYTLVIVHRLGEKDSIVLKTNSNAFAGYKNQQFVCEIDKNVLDEVNKCVSNIDDVTLDVNSYLGVIEETQLDISNALLSSGYSLDVIMNNYEWKEK